MCGLMQKMACAPSIIKQNMQNMALVQLELKPNQCSANSQGQLSLT
jgi:hypothetical protein